MKIGSNRSKVFFQSLSPSVASVSLIHPVLFSNNLNKHPFSSFTVKFTIKDLFPWTKVKMPVCDCNNNFPSHYSSFNMCIGIIFKTIMLILVNKVFQEQAFRAILQNRDEVLIHHH